MAEEETPTGMYQQGAYPSVVDTDDMVFEMGKQIVNHLNHEKLIGQLLKQVEALKKENQQLIATRLEIESKTAAIKQKMTDLEKSNKLYEENNRNLSSEIVTLHNQITELKTINQTQLQQLIKK